MGGHVFSIVLVRFHQMHDHQVVDKFIPTLVFINIRKAIDDVLTIFGDSQSVLLAILLRL